MDNPLVAGVHLVELPEGARLSAIRWAWQTGRPVWPVIARLAGYDPGELVAEAEGRQVDDRY